MHHYLIEVFTRHGALNNVVTYDANRVAFALALREWFGSVGLDAIGRITLTQLHCEDCARSLS